MPEQPRLFADEPAATTAAQSDAERAAYVERLREKLRDPEFRKIEGFPIGSDDAILALSDPPYYTACPNPFLPEIIEKWREERRQLRAKLGLPDDSPPLTGEGPGEGSNGYAREPFAADVSENKNDPIYNAHSYHTKVPHKAIMRYILHYTDPGDIVFDGFCGSGMTGVAAQLCGDRRAVEALGYRVRGGIVYDGERPISRLGARKAVLVDLSPAATFIAYNYNTPADAAGLLRELHEEVGLRLKPDADLTPLGPPALARLDVSVLHGLLLGPLLGIDAESMARQSHLTYSHDLSETLGRVAASEVQAAFLMNATKVAHVLDACEAGFVLPQKSTYFQPKLATGLVMARIEPEEEPFKA